MAVLRLLLLATVLCCYVDAVGFAPELYCGLENCYDVLEINREEFDRSTLSKTYRNLAKKFHPDRFQLKDDKETAEERFRVIATAYETLKDNETRTEYDYYLDNPEDRFYNYYQYYRRRAIVKVDVWPVLLGTILLISTIQGKLKKVKGRDNEAIIRGIVEENMDVKGGYRKPSIYNILIVRLVLLPYTIYQFIKFQVQWSLKYRIRGEEYDEDAKMYLVRKYLGVNEEQFESMSAKEHEEFHSKELWVKTNFDAYKAAKQEEERRKLQQSGRYKRMQRYMKNNNDSITFLDDE